MVFEIIKSFQKPPLRRVFFPCVYSNRRLIFWYAEKMIRPDSRVEGVESLRRADEVRKNGGSVTFISNHLSYADSHLIETLFIRTGFRSLADHLIHIAGQKTYDFLRRPFTRSLNTIRVYQPKAEMGPEIRRKMNSRALKFAGRLKKRGYSLLVFPEGTRARAGKRFNLHGANPRTANYFHNSFVVPLALMGSEKIMPVGQTLPSRASVLLRVSEPMWHPDVEQSFAESHSEETGRERRLRIMLHYMTRINALLTGDYQSSDINSS